LVIKNGFMVGMLAKLLVVMLLDMELIESSAHFEGLVGSTPGTDHVGSIPLACGVHSDSARWQRPAK
jgi:hypothetical protein